MFGKALNNGMTRGRYAAMAILLGESSGRHVTSTAQLGAATAAAVAALLAYIFEI